jgi:hypothetical protein
MSRTQYFAGVSVAALAVLAAACDSGDVVAAPRTAGVNPSRFRKEIATVTGPGPMLSAVAANVCADIRGGTDAAPASGTPLQSSACTGAANQRFALQASGEITAYGGALCLDVSGAQANDGDAVIVYACHGGANQKWTRTAAGELRTGVNGKCLDLTVARGRRASKVAVSTCTGGSDQRWTVRDAAPVAVAPAPVAPAPIAPTPVQPIDSAITPIAPVAAPVMATAGPAELPRVSVDTRMPAPTGRTISVAAGGDLQGALNAAQPGDVVVLAPGATFVGNFVLPAKANAAGQWITVRSGGSLPAEGTRVGPADAAQMPKLLTPNASAALGTLPGAQGWRLIGLEVGPTSNSTWSYHLVAFGDGNASAQTVLSQIPSRLVLDRSYVHGSATFDVRRCVGLNSATSAVIDSYLADCHSNQADSQAIAGWNGPGPFKIENNYLEAGHEVILFGGADPAIAGILPGDIEIRRNHVTRPTSWKGVWQVKNLLEFKAGQRALVEANVFENNWVHAQNGFAFVWVSTNQDGGCTTCVTQDVTFRYNRIRNVAGGFNLSAQGTGSTGATNPSTPMRRVTIAHNVITGLDGSNGRLYQVIGSVGDLTIVNNSGIGVTHSLTFATPENPLSSLVFRDNVAGGEYSFFASGGAMGANALTQLRIPGANVTGNVVQSGSGSASVPPNNRYVGSVSEIGFMNFAGGDLRLSTASSFRTSGTGGTTPGADIARVDQVTQGVVR